MNFNKAIRKQNKSYKRFRLSMCFIFLLLPLALFRFKSFQWFYIMYLALVEGLVLAAIVIRTKKNRLEFSYDGYRIKLKQGMWMETLNIICDKVALVHVEAVNEEEEGAFNIVIITSSKFRSDKPVPVNFSFLRSHTYESHYYSKIKEKAPEEEYFYLTIKSGGVMKYKLIDIIYRSCVYAHFSEETVEKVKYFRQYSS